ncbi:hypothetical protein [Prosthecobacter sp.]|jgi:hypothetical protein|uniref:hypothetical protein n=1 Tax=Prosthecobacter sp. TaxID=1965333 RepID=UPI0037831AEC
MKKPTFACLVLAALAVMPVAQLGAEEFPEEPVIVQADLDGDGTAEMISRRKLGADNQLGTFYQVLVKDARGSVLWRSPEELDTEHPLAFGEWDFGISLPQFAADVDQDGTVELIAPAPQSDVSPTYFRMLKWTGTAFKPHQSKALTGKAQKGAAFRWSERPSSSSYWVEKWIGTSAEGGWVVKLASLAQSTDGERMMMAVAVLATKGDGFELVRWIETPEALGAGGDESAGVRPDSYRAKLSAADHANSTGVPLKNVLEVLRQDRANVHRGTHRDREDDVDVFFTTPENREAMAQMELRVVGGAKAESAILRGQPVVEVQISNDGLQVEIIEP